MVAGKNSVPLEKVLLHMDLSKGLDERSRPEVGGEQSKLITGLNNLIQLETGGWEKRHGLSRLSSVSTDENGVAITGFSKAIPTTEGLCMSDLYGEELIHYHEGSDTFRSKGRLPDYTIKAHYVSAVQTAVRTGDLGTTVIANASCGDYEAVVYQAGVTPNGGSVFYAAVLVIYEKKSGSQVARYQIPSIGTVASGGAPEIKIAFVGIVGTVGSSANRRRYLHVWANDRSGGELQFIQIDAGASGTAWPASGTTLSYTAITGVVPVSGIYDIAAYDDNNGNSTSGSIVCIGEEGAYARNTSGTGFALAGHFESCYVADDSVWFLGRDFGGTGRVRVYEVDCDDISSASITDWIDPAVSPATFVGYNLLSLADGGLWYLKQDTTTFGATTIDRVLVYKHTFGGGNSFTLQGTLHGWTCESKPWMIDFNSRGYVHLGKVVQSTERLKAHVVISLDDIVTQSWNTSGVETNVDHFKVAVVLEPFNGNKAPNEGASPSLRYIPYIFYKDELSGFQQVTAYLAYSAVQRASAIAAYELLANDPARFNPASFGGNTYLGGGAIATYDGCRPSEAGIVDTPVFTIESVPAGALTGSYNYVAVYRHLDAKSNASYSRVFGPASVTLAAEDALVTIQACHVTSKESEVGGDQQIIVDLYRTTNGGTQYFLVASSQKSHSSPILFAPTAAFFTFTDTVLDATLITKPLLYRQPGTANTAVDRYPPPGGNILCSHKDRLFVTEPFGQTVYCSSFYVDGEAAWFNPLFFIRPHGGTGRITGLVSLDGRLIIFKKDAIFIVDGDGPPENGGNGTEFSQPAKLATEFGCIEPRSIVVTPNGIIYRSARGIELLTRSLQVVWIGDKVSRTLEEYPVTVASVLDSQGFVRIYCNKIEYGGPDGTGQIELVYDTTQEAWSTASSDLWATGIYSACAYDDYAGRRVVITTGSGDPLYINTSSKLDNGSYYGWSFETGWIRPSGPVGRFRFHDAHLLGKRVTDHKLKLSLAYDYGSYSQSRVWGPESLKETLEEVNLQPKMTQPVTFKFKAEEQSGGTLGTGQGLDLLNVCFVVSPKAGAQQVAEFKKG